LRVLLTTDAVGGVWRYSLTLAQEWAASGVAVELAVLGPEPNPVQTAEAQAVPGLVLHRLRLDLDWTTPDPASLDRIARRLARLAEERAVASVHLHAPALVGDARWQAPVVAVLHSCLLTWWQTMRSGPPPDDFAWRIDATAAGIARADHVVAPSRAFRDAIRDAYGSNQSIDAIHNGRAPLPAPAVPAAARPRTMLAAGRFWDEGKDVATLDAAARLLDAPVRAAGSFRGPNGQETTAPALHRLGSLDEPALARAFGMARAFISTARYEPFGLAVLEAAQAGMALVLTDIPSFRELWNDAALFVAPGDAAGFAAAAAHALDNPEPLARAARARADRYSAPAMAAATLALHRPAFAEKRIA
jgi:glycosyltransferase involved in cell wall biosynthesis